MPASLTAAHVHFDRAAGDGCFGTGSHVAGEHAFGHQVRLDEALELLAVLRLHQFVDLGAHLGHRVVAGGNQRQLPIGAQPLRRAGGFCQFHELGRTGLGVRDLGQRGFAAGRGGTVGASSAARGQKAGAGNCKDQMQPGFHVSLL